MQQGIVDAIFPMIYYAGNHFYPFVTDWCEGSHGRHVVAGMGTYQLHPEEKNWELEEVVRQLNVVRAHPIGGAAQFRSRFVTDNTKGVYTYMQHFYPYPALVPAMPWLSGTPPAAPQEIQVTIDRHTTTLSWEGTGDTVRYNIYASDKYPVDTEDPALLLATYLDGTTYSEPTHSLSRPRHYAVTAIDRYGNESTPLQWENSVVKTIKMRSAMDL
jgi:hypothetical protein